MSRTTNGSSRYGRPAEPPPSHALPDLAAVRDLVNSSPVILFEADRDGSVLRYVSSGITRILGYRPEEIVGRPGWLQEHLHPEDRAGDLIPEDRRELEHDIRLMASDGTYRSLHEVVRIHGEPTVVSSGIVGLAFDITDRKRFESDLTAAGAQFRTLVEQLPMAVTYIAALDGRSSTLYVSPQVEALLGYTQQEWLADPELWLECVHPDDREAVLAATLEMQRDNAIRGHEYRVVDRQGRIHWVLDRSRVVFNDAGSPISLLGVTLDITERKQAEAELRTAKEDAERASLAKNEFLSGMSHQLRTPMNAILGFGQLLEMAQLSPHDRESVQQILRAGEELLDMINAVLDFAKIEARRLTVSIEPVDVGEVAGETLELARPMAVRREVSLESTVALEPAVFVLADRDRLKQVILNLLSNAIKFNRPGGSVVVSTEESGDGRVGVRVTDTGQGIPADRLARLFAPFESMSAEYTRERGAGLGLALARRFVEAMGGAILVESTVGVGTSFLVTLPAVALTGAEPRAIGAPRGARGVRAAGPARRPATILYIEDNLANLSLVEHLLLRRPRIRLLGTMQARLGLELAREHRPDLILLDLGLPDLPGDELLRELGQDELTREIPVIVLSSDRPAAAAERLSRLGARALLTKPLDLQKLLDEVDAILGSGSAAS